MRKIMEIFAWTMAASIALTIIFVKAPKASGVSGGTQASDIIDAGGSNLSKVISSLEGGN